MQNVNRRSAMALGVAAASATLVKPAAAQTGGSPAATETSPFPGVVIRAYGEEHSLIPGFKTVAMRDVILQPGAKTKEETEMMNAMVCHVAEGELRIVQDGKTITGKKNYAWTCNKGTKEHVINDSNAVAIMRITDLKA
jgi:quercetin dioxygenase-like cupin family protein